VVEAVTVAANRKEPAALCNLAEAPSTPATTSKQHSTLSKESFNL